MFRRDILATLLSMVSATGVESLLEEIEAATDGLHADGGETTDPDTDGSESDSEQNDGGGESGNGETDDGTSSTGGSDSDGGDASDSGTRTAVVDRIEDGTAVVLYDDGSGSETVSAAVLPEAAREEGMVLRVPDGNSLSLATVDRTATAKRRRDAQDRFDELSERPPGSDDASNGTATP